MTTSRKNSEAADMRQAECGASPVIEVQGLMKNYGGQTLFENVTFQLQKGELLSLLGPSGVGKSTIFNIVAGLLNPDAGQVRMHGQDITGRSGHVAYMLQKDLLLPHLSIIDNVCLPLFVKKIPKAQAREKARQYLPIFGLAGYESAWPRELSGGMRQRAALLRTVLFGADVYLLDEPFSALDAMTKTALHEWFLQIQKELGLSVILITHDVDEALVLSNRILLLQGRPATLVEELTITEKRPRGDEFLAGTTYIEGRQRLMHLLKSREDNATV